MSAEMKPLWMAGGGVADIKTEEEGGIKNMSE